MNPRGLFVLVVNENQLFLELAHGHVGVLDDVEDLLVDVLLDDVLAVNRIGRVPHLVGDRRVDQTQQLLVSLREVVHDFAGDVDDLQHLLLLARDVVLEVLPLYLHVLVLPPNRVGTDFLLNVEASLQYPRSVFNYSSPDVVILLQMIIYDINFVQQESRVLKKKTRFLSCFNKMESAFLS